MIDSSKFEQVPAGAVSNVQGRSVTFVKTWWNMEKSMLRCHDHEQRLAVAKEWMEYLEELLVLVALYPEEVRLFIFRLADIFRLESIYLSRTQGGRLWQVLERVNQYEASGVAAEAAEYPGLVEEMVATFRDIMRSALHTLGHPDLAEDYYASPEGYEQRMLANAPRVDQALLSRAVGLDRIKEFELVRAKPLSRLVH